MTGARQSSERSDIVLAQGQITRAAQWLADQSRNPVPLIPALRGQFGLSIDEAHQAVVLADRMRMLREAFA